MANFSGSNATCSMMTYFINLWGGPVKVKSSKLINCLPFWLFIRIFYTVTHHSNIRTYIEHEQIALKQQTNEKV